MAISLAFNLALKQFSLKEAKYLMFIMWVSNLSQQHWLYCVDINKRVIVRMVG